MVSNLHQGLKHGLSKVLPAVTVLTLISTPVTAQSAAENCTIPGSLQPLFDLLGTLETLAFVAGVSLGVVGLSIGGVMIAGPFGEDWVRRGKQVAKNTILGVVILGSANMVVDFLISQLGPTFCS